ncbi:MAG: acyl carrier protein [Nitrospiria bacterium]
MSENAEEIQERIRQFFIGHAWLHKDEALAASDSLLEKGVIDSMAMVELTGFIGSTYGFEIPDEDLMPEHFDSLSAIATYILEKQGS